MLLRSIVILETIIVFGEFILEYIIFLVLDNISLTHLKKSPYIGLFREYF